MTYKITSSLTGEHVIVRFNHDQSKCCFQRDFVSRDYQKFLKDVSEQGLSIVEGPDVFEDSYVNLRLSEYPDQAEQLDMLYWDQVNGTSLWADKIQEIKDKYPKTIVGGKTIGPVPDWVQEDVDAFQAQ